MKLEGKVAIVTGAARGLGRAYALRLARLGADVAIVDINLDAAAEFGEKLGAASVQEEIEALGRRSIGVQADLASRDQVFAMVETVMRKLGRVDILVNNAGGALTPADRSKATQTPEEDARFLFDVNFMSTMFCCQAVAPIMKEQKSGVIVNISSQSAITAYPGGMIAAYGSAKAAVTHYTRYLATELGPFGIRANCLSPGVMLTARVAAQAAQRGIGDDKDAARVPLGRLGRPEDCAGVLEFLVTDLSQYVTGQCISVCGGVVMTPS